MSTIYQDGTVIPFYSVSNSVGGRTALDCTIYRISFSIRVKYRLCPLKMTERFSEYPQLSTGTRGGGT